MLRSLVVALALLVARTDIADADVLELKTGQRVEGTLKQATPSAVSIEVGGQTITFDGDKVRAIYFGTAPPPSTAAVSSTVEAMKALRALNSVVDTGITYRDYGPRVQDAKIVVDRYAQSGADPTAAPAIGSAMHYHTLAYRAWGLELSRASTASYESLGRDAAISQCQRTADLVDKVNAVSDRPPSPELQRMYRMSGGPPKPASKEERAGRALSVAGLKLLWACAADKIAEAEKLLAGAK